MWRRIQDVQSYLQDSVLYRTLDTSDCDEELGIPMLYHKPDTSAQSISEFLHLMDTARYWGVHQLPREVDEYIIDNGIASIEEMQACFEGYQEFAEYLQLLVDLRTLPPSERFRHALTNPYCDTHLLQYLFDTGCTIPSTTDGAAVETGNISCLEWIREHTKQQTESIQQEAALLPTLAAAEGKLPMLQYLHEQGYKWSSEVCEAAAKGGYLDCLQYAHENGCDWDSLALHNAAVNGHLACLKYAYEHGCTDWGAPGADTTAQIAANGHLDCLEYVHTHGCEWHRHTVNHAFRYGQQECPKYAIRNGMEPFDLTLVRAYITDLILVCICELFLWEPIRSSLVFAALEVLIYPLVIHLAFIYERVSHVQAGLLWILLSVPTIILFLILDEASKK